MHFHIELQPLNTDQKTLISHFSTQGSHELGYMSSNDKNHQTCTLANSVAYSSLGAVG